MNDYSSTGFISGILLTDYHNPDIHPNVYEIKNLGELTVDVVKEMVKSAYQFSFAAQQAYINVRNKSVCITFKKNQFISQDDYVYIVKAVCEAWQYSMTSELKAIQDCLIDELSIVESKMEE